MPVVVVLPEKTENKLRDYCQRKGLSTSGAIAYALDLYLSPNTFRRKGRPPEITLCSACRGLVR